MATDCTCIQVFGHGDPMFAGYSTCYCNCITSISLPPHFNKQTEISLEVCGADLGSVGAFIGRVATREVFIPASRLSEQLHVRLENVTLAEAAEQLGLGLPTIDVDSTDSGRL